MGVLASWRNRRISSVDFGSAAVTALSVSSPSSSTSSSSSQPSSVSSSEGPSTPTNQVTSFAYPSSASSSSTSHHNHHHSHSNKKASDPYFASNAPTISTSISSSSASSTASGVDPLSTGLAPAFTTTMTMPNGKSASPLLHPSNNMDHYSNPNGGNSWRLDHQSPARLEAVEATARALQRGAHLGLDGEMGNGGSSGNGIVRKSVPSSVTASPSLLHQTSTSTTPTMGGTAWLQPATTVASPQGSVRSGIMRHSTLLPSSPSTGSALNTADAATAPVSPTMTVPPSSPPTTERHVAYAVPWNGAVVRRRQITTPSSDVPRTAAPRQQDGHAMVHSISQPSSPQQEFSRVYYSEAKPSKRKGLKAILAL